MDMEATVSLLTDADNKQAYQALKDLISASEESGAVYPHFERFVQMMREPDNSYIRTRGLRLIAYNAKWDTENKVNGVIHEYLSHIEDEKPVTARQCIKDTVLIARYKPELIDAILAALEKINRVYDESMQSLVYKDRQNAIRQIRQYTW